MDVIEQFCQGKAKDQSLCEDMIRVTPDFIGLFDGATSRDGFRLGNRAPGRFAAETLAEGLGGLSAQASGAEAVLQLSALLKEKAEAVARGEGHAFENVWQRPAAALLVYSRARQEIWRVADSIFMIDGKDPVYRHFPQEDTWAAMRAVVLQAEIFAGRTEQELMENDPTWDLVTPVIQRCKVFANHDSAPYGYGVINGMPVPARHVEVFSAQGAKEIVFASDGYLEVFGTLERTEARVQELLKEDPLMYKIHPQVKGTKAGNDWFDDRSYVRFRVS